MSNKENDTLRESFAETLETIFRVIKEQTIPFSINDLARLLKTTFTNKDIKILIEKLK
jgi:hypothetical protein